MPPRAEISLFQLADRDGRPYGTADLWQRSDMVLAVVHGKGCVQCEEVVRLLSTQSVSLHQNRAEPLVVSRGEAFHVAGLRVLTDVDGQVTRRLLGAVGLSDKAAAVFVADRFARLFGTEDVHVGSPDQVLARAMDWLDFAQSQCEECGAPVDWA